MTEFRTTFPIEELSKKIDYKSNILSFGSCFSENIGEKLTHYKFNALINPFGILYNPESIAHSFEILFKKKLFTESDIFEHNGTWNSFYHHSRFSHTNKNECLALINSSIEKAVTHIQKADFVIITFGTAWVYELKRNSKIVSNCHKVPAKEFSRFRLAPCDIVERYKSLIRKIKNININCKIIFTVSPVRHLKDGVNENQLSKATLLMAVNELVETFEKVYYFPSYELMMDDLRDYRFYAKDMVHPSQLAIDYIWEKFKECVVDKNTFLIMREIEKIRTVLNHRPFQPESEAYQNLLKNNLDKIEDLKKKFPEMDVEKEVDFINNSIL